MSRIAYALANAGIVLAMALTALVTIRESVAFAHAGQSTYIAGYVEAVAGMLADFARGYDATLPAAYPQLWPVAYVLAHVAYVIQCLGGR